MPKLVLKHEDFHRGYAVVRLSPVIEAVRVTSIMVFWEASGLKELELFGGLENDDDDFWKFSIVFFPCVGGGGNACNSDHLDHRT